MPATSEAQKTASCMALAIKRGDLKPKEGSVSAKMAESMSEEELVLMCGSKPDKKK